MVWKKLWVKFKEKVGPVLELLESIWELIIWMVVLDD